MHEEISNQSHAICHIAGTTKMKVLFVFQGRTEVDENGRYFGNELNDKVIERYRYFGDSVTFMVRTRPIHSSEIGGLTQLPDKSFNIIPIPELNNPLLLLKNYSKVSSLIKKAVAEHDVLIARLPGLIARIAIHFAKMFKKPYLVEVVGCPWDALWNHSAKGKLYAPYAYWKLRQGLKDAPYILYVTENFLQNRYPSRGFKVGVTDVVLKDLSEENLRNRLRKIQQKKKEDPLILGTVAALDVKYKGQGFVIRSLAKLKKKGYYCRYKLVGNGDNTYLESVAKGLGVIDQVEFIGQIPHDKVFEFLDSIDVYVQPSKQEGLPRAVVEAMSRACPCVGSNTGGIPELIEKEFLFSKGNVAELTEILMQLDQHKLLQQAQRNFAHAKKYSLEKMDIKRRQFYEIFKASYI